MKTLRDLAARRPFAVALLAALALLLVPYRTLLGPGVPSGRDLVPYFYPLKTHLVEALRAGEMPRVDRFRQGGLPLLSSPGVAAFDPGNVLFLLLPTAAAAKAWMLLRVLSGAAGFAVFLRLSGLPPFSSALGAVAWGASGVTASSASFLSTSSALAALPWLAAALLHARRERSARAVATLAAATALLLVASVPEPLVAAVVVSLVLLAGRGEGHPLRERVGAVALWGAAGLLGALLAAPVLGAFLVTGLESIRSVRGALLPEFAFVGALPPVRLAEVLADGIVADWTAKSLGEGVSGYPYFPSLTPGRAAWTLALLGLLASRGARWRASVLAALGVLLALGPATPVFGWLCAVVPFAGSIRYPEKWMVLFSFGVVWLAALGAATLERALPRRSALLFGVLGLVLAADRAGITPRLIPISDPSLLEARPVVLAGLPSPGGDAPPPRLLPLAGKRVPDGVAPDDPKASGAAMSAWAIPWTFTRFGVASVLEPDYDAALPHEQFEWTLLLEKMPAESPAARALARAAGAVGAIYPDRDAVGRLIPRLFLFAEPVAPVRFVERVSREAGLREAATRFLRERAPVDAAILPTPGAPFVPSPGRVLRVSDRPSRLEIEVEVTGPGTGYLLVCRPLVATRAATLDGRSVTVDDANIGFTGLAVPPGRHVVRLQPPGTWLIIAAVSSALGLGALITLFLRGRSRGRAAR